MPNLGCTTAPAATRSSKVRRGFVLLIVVMLLAVLGVAVAVQLDTARGQSIESSRTRDDAAARAVAETCLDLLLAQTRGYLTSSTPPPPDFDPLLDPKLDDTSKTPDDDDFLPPALGAGSVVSGDVFLPKGSTRPSGHYRLYRFTADGSACLVRFDDNSDDAVPSPMLPPAATGNSNGVAEGPGADVGRDVLNRDRDRAIQLTAIGLFPAAANVADDDVFDRAHARVTLRRVIETSGGPAIWAGERILTAQDNAVCGLGGLTADVLDQGSDTLCACGEQNLGTTPAAQFACDYTSSLKPGSMCDDNSRACEPRVLGAVKKQIDPYDPSPTIDSPIEELVRDTGGDPDTNVSDDNWRSSLTIGNPGTNSTFEVYVRHKDARDPEDPNGKTFKQTTFAPGVDAEIYVWNNKVNGVVNSLGLDALTCSDALPAACAVNPDCADFPRTEIPPPCRFTITRDGGGNVTSSKSDCRGTVPDGPDAGSEPDVQESRCWQLVAQLDGKAGEDLVKGTLADQLLSSPLFSLVVGTPNVMGLREDTVMEDGHEVWRPVGAPSPGILGLANLTSVLNTLLGVLGLTSVQTWSTAAGGDWTTTNIFYVDKDGDDDDDDDGHNRGHDNIIKHEDWDRANEFAARSVLLFENPLNKEVIFDGNNFGAVAGDENHPIQTLVVASGDVHFEGKVGVCCPSCVCPDNDASTVVPDSMPVQGGSNSDANPRTRPCSGTDGVTPLMNPLAPLTSQPIRSRLAVRTGGHCLFEKDSSVVGDVMCQTVHIKGGGCFVSDVFGHGACEDGTCDCKGGSCGPGRKKNKLDRGKNDSGCAGLADPSGCEEPGVCIGKSGSSPVTTIIGATFSRGDVCVSDPLTTYGQVIAADDVRLGPEVVVNHDGTTGGGVGAIVSTVAWIEASR